MNIRPTRAASLQYVLTTLVVMILSTAATADQPGACCWEDVNGTWTCAYISDDDCLAIGGTWGGGGIPCDAIDCPPLGEVVGACCYITEGYGLYCAEINYLDCMANSGTYWGDNVVCNDPSVELCGPCVYSYGALCAGKPQYQDAAYTNFLGAIAVQTASPQISGGQVLTVYDLSMVNASPAGTLLNAPRYSHPSWNATNLGSIFGLALDGDGNVYVSASRTWNSSLTSGPAGWGAVYSIDTVTSAVSVFAVLPNASTEGLGSITFDCDHQQFFVSNFGDGKIYRLDMAGAILDTYDHGIPWDGSAGPVGVGDRPWAVEVHHERLFYSMWNEDMFNGNASVDNTIWSVPLDAAGKPIVSDARLEIILPQFLSDKSSPVSDIRFSPNKGGSMFLAERTQNGYYDLTLDQARILEYACAVGDHPSSAGLWVETTTNWVLGPGGTARHATGGVDVTMDRVWAGCDDMRYSAAQVDEIGGLQGIPINTGGGIPQSILVDYQGDLSNVDWPFLGDVVYADEVDCPLVQIMSVNCLTMFPPYNKRLVRIAVTNRDAATAIAGISLDVPSGMTITPGSFSIPIAPLGVDIFQTELVGGYPGGSVCIDVLVEFVSGDICGQRVCIESLNTCGWIRGDFDFDAMVGVDDLMSLIGRWAEVCDGVDQDCNFHDIDDSGLIDMGDLLMLLDNWTV